MTCPSCEYNKARAQLWRNEAYKLSGHPLDWEPELMVRPKPLTDDEIAQAMYRTDAIVTGPMQFKFAREVEAKLKEKNNE